MLRTTEIQAIKQHIRSSYALPIRDFIEFCYKEHLNETDQAFKSLVGCHYQLFLSTLSEDLESVPRNNAILQRISLSLGLSPEIIAGFNIRLMFELIKIIASQNRNSTTSIAKHCIFISIMAHSLWSAGDQTSMQPQNVLFNGLLADQLNLELA